MASGFNKEQFEKDVTRLSEGTSIVDSSYDDDAKRVFKAIIEIRQNHRKNLNEVVDLARLYSVILSKNSEISKENDKFASINNNLTSEIEDLQDSLLNKEAENQRVEKKYDTLNKKYEEQIARANYLDRSVSDLEKQLQQQKSEYDKKLENQNNEIEFMKKSYEEQIAILNKRSNKRKNMILELRDKLRESKKQLARCNKKLDGCVQERIKFRAAESVQRFANLRLAKWVKDKGGDVNQITEGRINSEYTGDDFVVESYDDSKVSNGFIIVKN